MLTQNKPITEISSKQRAEQATIQSFLNCYLKETNNLEIIPIQSQNLDSKLQTVVEKQEIKNLIISHLTFLQQKLIIPVQHLSPTSRHIFAFPIFLESENTEIQEIDYINLVKLISQELSGKKLTKIIIMS